MDVSDEERNEWLNERAAILEYDAKMSRDAAELMAWEMWRRKWPTNP